ncbi:MAG TPA: YciI family protein [Flavobacteriales bacterium]|nr:YciI family protein [Flavobacteriales bacterium]HMR27296.1 YciI family protein [Flavobacteriales bacterium]
MRTILLLLLPVLSGAVQAQRTFDVTIADSTYHMKQYWFVLYTRGDGPVLDSLTAATLQREHLAHQGDQAKRGLIVMAGPFDTNGEGWRGLLLYDCDTREEVEGYLRQDPFVKVGRLKYSIAPWWGAIGTRLP